MKRFAALLGCLCTAVLLQTAVAPVARADFAITTAVPTLEELSAQIHLLVATPAPDEVKAAQLEGGDHDEEIVNVGRSVAIKVDCSRFHPVQKQKKIGDVNRTVAIEVVDAELLTWTIAASHNVTERAGT